MRPHLPSYLVNQQHTADQKNVFPVNQDAWRQLLTVFDLSRVSTTEINIQFTDLASLVAKQVCLGLVKSTMFKSVA